MLKLIKILKPVREFIEFDFNVIANIEFEYHFEDQKPYRYLMSNGYVEIGINQQTGAIGSITLLFTNQIYHFNEKKIKTNNNTRGLPVFPLDKWAEDSYSINEYENKKLNICVGKETLSIIMHPEKKIESMVTNDRVIFGFDKNKFLCLIKVTKITSQEMAIIYENFDKTKYRFPLK